VNDSNRNELGSSLLQLFRDEADNETAILTAGLLEWERDLDSIQPIEKLLRAAHSLKGAARIVNLQPAVLVAHAMEDCLVAAQSGHVRIQKAEIDLLFRGVDLLQQISKAVEDDTVAWEAAHAVEIEQFLAQLKQVVGDAPKEPPQYFRGKTSPGAAPELPAKTAGPMVPRKREPPERLLRLAAENLNHLLGLAGESLVESRWLRPFSDSMQRLKHLHLEVAQLLYSVRAQIEGPQPADADTRLEEALAKLVECQQFFAEKLEELDLFDRRSAHLSHRLYLEVLRARMRPFGDAVRRMPRMVRDLARSLHKEVRLEISGDNTPVDRDILERLEVPLAHMLRNAVDHGCEAPADRERAGKRPEGRIQLDAHHSAGMLLVTVSDDGPGIDLDRLRRLIVEKALAPAPTVEKLSQANLMEFLFRPGFTLKDTVTEVSGRGIGLDVVQNMVKSVRGSARITTEPGRGTRLQLQLPLTLSVLRTLLVSIAGEAYAFPLSRIHRTLKLSLDKVQTVEGRRYFTLENRQLALLSAQQVLDYGPLPLPDDLSVVVVGENPRRYGLIVDRLLGERELVVQPLDSRLGKVKGINAAALMEDGSPALIIDIEEMLDSIEGVLAASLPSHAPRELGDAVTGQRKRILAVDDSAAVREVQRKLLANRGYIADVAIDGIDGWNAVRAARYDLVITDVDMPRMGGIELVARIKADPHLRSVPVLMVSYKDADEDRLRALQAGADFYLTKGSFHSDALLKAVLDLIGQPEG